MKKRDLRYIRRIIPDGKTICQNVLLVVNCNVAQDLEAKKAHGNSSGYIPNQSLTPAHIAFPLITPRVWQEIKKQSIHMMNGCLTDNDVMCRHIREEQYRDTRVSLPVY
jgi:hypothetical protein